jgi:hypothetical protein
MWTVLPIIRRHMLAPEDCDSHTAQGANKEPQRKPQMNLTATCPTIRRNRTGRASAALQLHSLLSRATPSFTLQTLEPPLRFEKSRTVLFSLLFCFVCVPPDVISQLCAPKVVGV